MGDVVNLANETKNGTYTDVSTTLRSCLEAVERGPDKYDRCIVILLNTEESRFDVGFYNAKMTCSQILAACEVMKARCLSAMMGWMAGKDSVP